MKADSQCDSQFDRPKDSLARLISLSVLAIGLFKLAFTVPQLSMPAMLGFAWVVCLLTIHGTIRTAFYAGLVIGSTLAGIELNFFHDIFGPGAIGLWLILGVWMALFMLSAALVQRVWPNRGIWFVPLLWIGFEYFRGELYYLRFTWVTPGLSLVESPWQDVLSIGQYGAGGTMILCGVMIVTGWRRGIAVALTLLAAPLLFFPSGSGDVRGPVIAGVQLEFPDEATIPQHLDKVLQEVPDADLIMLSEYTFDGPIPEPTRAWCDENDCYLVVGGKQLLENGQFRNTVFVCDSGGEIVHTQVKAVPIQFFSDGLPAEEQVVWDSPFGRVGFAICYDMSYTRVIDELVRQDAQIILNPTMDPVDWGAYEHALHSRIPIARAEEYGIPVFRLASSGISHFVDGTGHPLATGSFPDQGMILRAQVELPERGRLPIDRVLAMLSVLLTPVVLIGAIWQQRKRGRTDEVASATAND